jgi:hypothetical protein
MPGSLEEFARFIQVDARKWSEVLRSAGVKVE